jgi:FMN phosphatase YigB (HAD superfamily)
MIASFDIFDTLIYRKFATPSGVWLELGESLRRECLHIQSSEEFAIQRRNAEVRARDLLNGRDPTLQIIYELLASEMGWTDGQRDQAAQEEIAIEVRSWIVAPGVEAEIKRIRGQCKKIVFLSDMYLSTDLLRRELQRLNLAQEGDLILISGESGSNKASGGLFRLLMEVTGVRASEIHHIGDNFESDFRSPLRLGVSAEWRLSVELSEREKYILTALPGRAGEHLGGVSRQIRLSKDEQSTHYAALKGIACSVAAPVLAIFIEWVFRVAARSGIRRIYFVARDGHALKIFADQLCATRANAPETRLIYGSRRSWHPPARLLGKNDLSWAFDKSESLTLDILLDRLQIDAESAEQIIEKAELKNHERTKLLSPSQIVRLERTLSQAADSSMSMDLISTGSTHAVLSYLRQEGFGEPVPSAIVDLGWNGRLHESLNTLLVKGGMNAVSGMYFGLCKNRSSPTLSGTRSAFLFDERLERKAPTTSSQISLLMESFCTMRTGTTTGYYQCNGKWLPRLSQAKESALIEWGVDVVNDAYSEYAKKIRGSSVFNELSDRELAVACARILRAFIEKPSETEAVHWGAFPFEDGQPAADIKAIGRPLFAFTKTHLKSALTGRVAPSSAPLWVAGAKRNTAIAHRIMWHIASGPVRTSRKIKLAVQKSCVRTVKIMARIIGSL